MRKLNLKEYVWLRERNADFFIKVTRLCQKIKELKNILKGYLLANLLGLCVNNKIRDYEKSELANK